MNTEPSAEFIPITHTEFSHFTATRAAKEVQKFIPKSTGKNQSQYYLVSGGGFGYSFFNAEDADFDDDPDSYDTVITSLEKEIAGWGKTFQAELHSNSKHNVKAFIIGVDCAIAYSGSTDCIDNLGAQFILWVPPEGKIHVIWKCYPANLEKNILIYPTRDDDDGSGRIPSKSAMTAHFIEDTMLLMCHEFCAPIPIQAAKKPGSWRHRIEQLFNEEILKRKGKIKQIFCLMHTESNRWKEGNRQKLASLVGVDIEKVVVIFGEE